MLDEPIRIDDYSMVGDGHPLCFKGLPLPLTRGELQIAWTLMKAFPSHVSDDAIFLRSDNSDRMSNTIKVLVHRIRRKAQNAGAPDPVDTVWGRGYRWRPGGGNEIAEKAAAGDHPVTEILAGIYAVPEPEANDSSLG